MMTAPVPSRAASLAEFIAALGDLRVWAGNPSYRTLARRAGPVMRPPQELSASTIADVFKTHRRRLNLDLVVAILRALGLDDAEVDQWRHSYLRLRRGVEAPGGQAGVLRQLPADLATFTGRSRELGVLLELAEAAADGARTVVVSAIEGMAGMGKTRLAVHAAHELIRSGRCADVQLYVNLRGFDLDQPPAEPFAVLAGFLRQLDVPAQHIPETVEERAALFRDRLHGRDALVLLDNAADEKQVRHLIPAGPGTVVLITSRRRLAGLDGAALVALPPFSPDEGVALLAKVVGPERVATDPGAAAEIVRLCGGLPLALAIAASRLRSRPAWTVADLAARLRANMVTGLRDGSRSPWAVFDLSYAGLPEDARRVFRLLALHPGHDVTAASVAALAGITQARATEHLDLLTDEHLLLGKDSGRYEYHDVIRIYAQEKLAEDEPEPRRAEALDNVLTWYLAAAHAASVTFQPITHPIAEPAGAAARYPVVFAEAAEARTWYANEIANLLDAVAVAHRHERHALSSQLSAPLNIFLLSESRWQDIIGVRRIGLAGAVATQDIEGEVMARCNIGVALDYCGRAVEAEEQYEEALTVARRAGKKTAELFTLGNMIGSQTFDKRPQVVLALAHHALQLARELEDDAAMVQVQHNLAITLNANSRPREALAYLSEALAASKRLGDSRYLAPNLHGTGFTRLLLEDYAGAETDYAKAAELFHAAGDDYRQVECLHGLARALHGQGRTEEAREAVAQAETILGEHDQAGYYRQRLASSPVRFSESTRVDPAARA